MDNEANLPLVFLPTVNNSRCLGTQIPCASAAPIRGYMRAIPCPQAVRTEMKIKRLLASISQCLSTSR